jgi:hypothetical protein
MPFLLWHFSPRDEIENCPAQILAVCWFVHFELFGFYRSHLNRAPNLKPTPAVFFKQFHFFENFVQQIPEKQ